MTSQLASTIDSKGQFQDSSKNQINARFHKQQPYWAISSVRWCSDTIVCFSSSFIYRTIINRPHHSHWETSAWLFEMICVAIKVSFMAFSVQHELFCTYFAKSVKLGWRYFCTTPLVINRKLQPFQNNRSSSGGGIFKPRGNICTIQWTLFKDKTWCKAYDWMIFVSEHQWTLLTTRWVCRLWKQVFIVFRRILEMPLWIHCGS